MKIDPERYNGHTGYLKVKSGVPNESPIWCPVRILAARPAYQRMDLTVEPLGGFGVMKASAKRVYLEDKQLNQCQERPC